MIPDSSSRVAAIKEKKKNQKEKLAFDLINIWPKILFLLTVFVVCSPVVIGCFDLCCLFNF